MHASATESAQGGGDRPAKAARWAADWILAKGAAEVRNDEVEGIVNHSCKQWRRVDSRSNPPLQWWIVAPLRIHPTSGLQILARKGAFPAPYWIPAKGAAEVRNDEVAGRARC
ncbi:hypothetical protein GCM10010970_27110 [Silvimonas iriomotensis]|uniref:Uncharacterized protein n=1 Tax=Silvimonas iriomotensis TaxID=449662 RepID=A0ABQ2PBW6_9NEIS|nr:hypothetical protein GCM10010970_27110 [Silvimonas iriomotensis]